MSDSAWNIVGAAWGTAWLARWLYLEWQTVKLRQEVKELTGRSRRLEVYEAQYALLEKFRQEQTCREQRDNALRGATEHVREERGDHRGVEAAAGKSGGAGNRGNAATRSDPSRAASLDGGACASRSDDTSLLSTRISLQSLDLGGITESASTDTGSDFTGFSGGDSGGAGASDSYSSTE